MLDHRKLHANAKMTAHEGGQGHMVGTWNASRYRSAATVKNDTASQVLYSMSLPEAVKDIVDQQKNNRNE